MPRAIESARKMIVWVEKSASFAVGVVWSA
jgi:hypothetical protein